MEHSGVLPTTQFAYWKGLGTCDALLYVSHTLHWRVGIRLGSFRLFSAQPLIGSIIREFCISSVLWYWTQFLTIKSIAARYGGRLY